MQSISVVDDADDVVGECGVVGGCCWLCVALRCGAAEVLRQSESLRIYYMSARRARGRAGGFQATAAASSSADWHGSSSSGSRTW